MLGKDFFTEKQLTCLSFFESNLPDYLKDEILKNKYVVVHDEKLKGAYDTFDLALSYALSNFPKNEFIIQQVIDNKEIINFLKSAV